ncbi:VQ motif-containing protein 1-like [Arachis hypogaea]|uniref:VQ motif-containing protein 1-like n=1 Tax=Arachis hypogaea TaxID=3818 RepID=UPI000DEC31E0|nr:VQ motif-containing protein 1-like [Arachis hypogaea]
MSGYGSGSNKGPVKVVIINTQYVETDATSFKSVVQKLTGKDSSDDYGKPRNNNNNGFVNQFLIRDMSFKEFDRLFSQMPPINDILSE